MRRAGAGLLAVLLLLLGGCASLVAPETRALARQPPDGLPRQVELAHTPFHPQAQDTLCGPESLAAALGAAGIGVPVATLADWVYLPGRSGALQAEMLAATRRAGAVALPVAPALAALMRELAAGHPVVVLQNLGLQWTPSWHYAVAVGYDLDTGVVLLRSGPMHRQAMPMATFELTWARSGSWGFVALRPGQLAVSTTEPQAQAALIGFGRVATPSAAAQAWGSALQRWPHNLPMAIGLGGALYAAGDLDAAAATLAQAATQHRSAAAYNNLARVELARGRWDPAHAAAQKAVSLDDGFAETARETLRAVQQAAPAR